jgi:tRNA-uridine 2-sulfurtransferase
MVIVGAKTESGRLTLHADDVNWIAGMPPLTEQEVGVKIRYKAHETPCAISEANQSSFQLKFNHPLLDITPGQAAVLYNGEVCLGGGIIAG